MRWLWIDRILDVEPGERLVAIKHVSLAEEHLRDHFPAERVAGLQLPPDPVMPASLIIEGSAQSAGILVGLAADFREKVILAKISKAILSCDARPGDTIRFDASLDRMDDAGAAATVRLALSHPASSCTPAEQCELGVVELMFSHIDKNFAGARFPEHNFVFSDSFRMLLELSGVPLPPGA